MIRVWSKVAQFAPVRGRPEAPPSWVQIPPAPPTHHAFRLYLRGLFHVESTFSMIKRKFGDSLRSKTDTAMVNETLCKILCHNLVVLIHETQELGIETNFAADFLAQAFWKLRR